MNVSDREELESIQRNLLDAQGTIALALLKIKMMLDAPQAEPVAIPPAPAVTVSAEPRPVPEVPLVITPEWQAVLDILRNGADDVFITGGAGVGKTTLLHEFIKDNDSNIAVVAPTGVAAIRANGQTLHSFFHFPPHALDEDDIAAASDPRQRSKFKALHSLIVDEVSMLRADGMDGIDLALRKNRGNEQPFGGVRIILFGDPYQLPPVAKERDEKRWLKAHYGVESPFFFHARCFREKRPAIHALTTVFRQKDEAFINALNAMRDGTLSESQLELLNSRVAPGFKPPADELWITLTTTNASADLANQRMLNAIQAPAETFEAFVTGDFNLKDAPTDEYLSLKVGAAVMFIRNDTSRFKRWANGTLGRVASTKPLRVEVNGNTYDVERETWEKISYVYDEKTKKLSKTVVGSFSQIPLKLAAAITIHKGQGCSFDQVVIDLGTGTFASGQAYTAFSRCRTLAGMKLLRPLRMEDLIVSSEVRAFMTGKPIARPQPSNVLTQQAML
ncbi:MAG: AAA family ATPase [Bryobacterales bacterium]|nr:AAA family ATPase [Bryobacterales bacterium]